MVETSPELDVNGSSLPTFFPTGKALLETTSVVENPPSASLKHPDYLQLILTARVYDIVSETPLTIATNLSTKIGTNVLLKREDLQPVFSFKIRGAYNKMAHLSAEEKRAGIIACSAGNHAQGVAMAAKKMDIKATIVMPLGTPAIKFRNVMRLGAEVVLHGADFDEAKKECARLAAVHNYTDIPPYDDPYVIAGQGTIGVEILRQHPLDDIKAIFCCVGGGGLISGIASYVKRVAPHIKLFGVETHDANAMTQSLAKGNRVELKEVGLFADGAAVRLVGEETFRICREFDIGMITVDNDEICAAIKDVFEDTRSICEPAGVLAVAGLKKYIAEHPEEKDGSYIAVCSGANMNFERLRFVAERAELGEQTEAFVCVTIPEGPGSFAQMISHIYPRSVTEFSYRFNDPDKAFIYMSFKVHNRDRDVPEILASWKYAGIEGFDISDNEMAKSHARYLVGGKSNVENERIFRFEFPERPGALQKFLSGMETGWNVSLFHYRNHGDDMGKILAGIQVPPSDSEAFDRFLENLNYHFVEETDNPVYKMFLR